MSVYSIQSKDKADTVTRIYRITNNELNTFSTEFDEYEDGYNYLAGEQYEHDVKEWWKTQRRPVRAHNIIFPIFNRVLGEFLLNDEGMKVYPLPGGTQRIAYIFQQLIEHANEQNNNKYVLMNWALAGIIKRGFTYARFSNEKAVDGSLVFTNLDEFEVIFDHRAKDYFLDDAAYVIRSRWMDEETILNTWPQHRSQLKELLADRERNEFWGAIEADTSQMMNNRDFVNEREGKYRIVEFHEFEYKEAEVAYNPLTGQAEIFALEGKKADLYLKMNPDVRIITRPNQKIKKITTIIPGLNFLLDEKEADLQDGQYDIIPFSAYTYSKYVINNFGVFRNAKEPQDSYNEWQNESEALLKKTVDPGHIYDPARFQNPQDIENFGRMPGLNLKLNDGEDPNKAIKINEIPQLPFAADQKMQEEIELLWKITGVPANLQGMDQTKQENASLFAQRVNQAKISLQVLYHNWIRSKQRLNEKKIRLMQENYKTERYFLITSPDPNTGSLKQEEIIINQRIGNMVINDISNGRYKVFIDEMERNPTAKALRFMQKMELAQILVQWYGPQAIDPEWLLGDSNLGDIDKLIQNIYASMQQMSEQGQQAEAIEVTKQLQEMAQKQLQLEDTGLPAEAGPEKNK